MRIAITAENAGGFIEDKQRTLSRCHIFPGIFQRSLPERRERSIRVALGSQQPPDIYFVWSGEKMLKSFIRGGNVLDITKYLDADNGAWRQRIPAEKARRAGVIPLAWSLDHVGPMTRSVADAAAVLDAIAVAGGLNIGNEYFRADPDNPDATWRDQDVVLRGAIVRDLVTGELDGGPIVLQRSVPVTDDDTPDSLAARILAVADSYDAMISDRSYKPARSPQEALEELRRCRGTRFDPDCVDAFIAHCCANAAAAAR